MTELEIASCAWEIYDGGSPSVVSTARGLRLSVGEEYYSRFPDVTGIFRFTGTSTGTMVDRCDDGRVGLGQGKAGSPAHRQAHHHEHHPKGVGQGTTGDPGILLTTTPSSAIQGGPSSTTVTTTSSPAPSTNTPMLVAGIAAMLVGVAGIAYLAHAQATGT